MTTPLAQNANAQNEHGHTNFPYRETIGGLLYLMCKTRPDIAYAVIYESRSMEKPTNANVKDLKRTLRYLKGSVDKGIFYGSKNALVLKAFSDADYADLTDRKSTTGYVILLGDSPIAWCSKKQKIVSLSTTEAEYIAGAECCRELKYLKSLLHELLDMDISATLCVDNQSAIKLIKSGQMSRQSKHIDVRYHFISEELVKKLFTIEY